MCPLEERDQNKCRSVSTYYSQARARGTDACHPYVHSYSGLQLGEPRLQCLCQENPDCSVYIRRTQTAVFILGVPSNALKTKLKGNVTT